MKKIGGYNNMFSLFFRKLIIHKIEWDSNIFYLINIIVNKKSTWNTCIYYWNLIGGKKKEHEG